MGGLETIDGREISRHRADLNLFLSMLKTYYGASRYFYRVKRTDRDKMVDDILKKILDIRDGVTLMIMYSNFC